MDSKNDGLTKLILIVALLGLIIRVVTSYTASNQIEGFTSINMDNLDQPKSNQVVISRIKHNPEDESYEIMFDKVYSINYIHILTNVLNVELNYVVYYKDSDGNYNENFVFQNDVLEHSNRTHQNKGNLVMNDPRISQINKPKTEGLKIKLLDSQPFNIHKAHIFGLPNGFVVTSDYLQDNIKSQVPVSSHERTTDQNTGQILYKLKLNVPQTNIYGLQFNYGVDNLDTTTNQNVIFKAQVHFEHTTSDGKTATYKLNQTLPTSDYNSTDTGYLSNIYFEKPIDAKTLFLSIPKNVVVNGNDYRISNLSMIKLLVGTQTDSFQNVKNNKKKSGGSDSKKRENFQSVEYSADNLCPSLSGVENQMKLADSICERIEYNDKIKNERLKLERNKQYIMKLKAQDEEIETLEKLIKSLQGTRGKRDEYNDALRLAQLQEQKKKATLVKQLADKRIKHKKTNQLQVELNLVDTPPYQE